jgi:hypothetical protein
MHLNVVVRERGERELRMVWWGESMLGLDGGEVVKHFTR